MTPIVLVCAVAVACLAPFAAKAFALDDTFYLHVARRILVSPLDPYGFSINWFGYATEVPHIVHNPPLTMYWLAAGVGLFGESEVALHLWFLLPCLAALAGMCLLARDLAGAGLRGDRGGDGTTQILAAGVVLCTPAFLVMGTTLLLEAVLLPLMVWGVWFWNRGLDREQPGLLFLASLCVVLAFCTKYAAVALIPLLGAYALARRSRVRLWGGPLALAVLGCAGFVALLQWRYGVNPFADAVQHSLAVSSEAGGGAGLSAQVFRLFTGLAFTGGGAASVLFFLPELWRPRWWVFWMGVAVVCGFALAWAAPPDSVLRQNGELRWGLFLQMACMVVGGVHVLTLVVAELARRRDAPAVLLCLWVVGYFVFATWANWAVNVRSVLLFTPALGLLVARRLAARRATLPQIVRFVPLIPAVAVALLVASADAHWANSARSASETIAKRVESSGLPVWFMGHWGFQYYMEKFGARPVDMKDPRVRRGDLLVVPSNNTNVVMPDASSLRPVGQVREAPHPLLTVHHMDMGAGFHASVFGPMPFVFGRAPDDIYTVYQVR